MRSILLISLFILSNNFHVNSQELLQNSQKVIYLIDSLRNERIDTFALYEKYCPGKIFIIEKEQSPCYVLPSFFVVWKKNSCYYFLKVNDECKYQLVTSDSCILFDYYFNNQILKGKDYFLLTPFTVTKGRRVETTLHSCNVYIKLFYNKKEIFYNIDEYIFNKEVRIKSSEMKKIQIIQKWLKGIEVQIGSIEFRL
jgi:hypothetical protein